jgi:hypothetical protein
VYSSAAYAALLCSATGLLLLLLPSSTCKGKGKGKGKGLLLNNYCHSHSPCSIL